MNSLKVLSFSLLFLSNGLWIPDGYAMDPPYEKGASPQGRVVPQAPRLQVVSPEAVEIEQQLKQHVQLYPDVADSNPKIQTLEDFKNAKTYLILFEKYNYCLHAVLMASMSNPIAIDACLGYESGLIHYAQTLGRDSSLPFRSAQDEVDLRRILYAGYYRLGIARLEDFHISQSSLPLDQQIKKLELVTQILPILYQSPDSRHFLDFKRYVQLRTAASFSQMELNHPFMLSKPSLRKFIIDDQEELKRAAASVSSDELEKFRESFDINFSIKSYQLALQFNDILKAPPPNASELLKDNMKTYFELEKDGLRFKARVDSKKNIDLNDKSLKEFYDFLTQLLKHLPQKDPVAFLPHIILSLVTADQKEEALKRLSVLEYLLLKKGTPLTQNFIIFRAKIKAMCSNCDELNHLFENQSEIPSAQSSEPSSPKLTQKQLKKREKKRRYKDNQKKRKQAELLAASKEPSTTVENDITPKPSVLPGSDDKKETPQEANDLAKPVFRSTEPASAKPSLLSVTKVDEESSQVSKNVRIEQTKEAHRWREKSKLLSSDEAASVKTGGSYQPTTFPLKEEASGLIFTFSSKSCKILNKIFMDDWKISREDIEVFFREIGQEVNTKTGSSHNVIRISEGIAMIKDGKIIGIISDLSANMDGHISLPRWEKTVPLYTRKDVKKLIEHMNITKDNYKKGREPPASVRGRNYF